MTQPFRQSSRQLAVALEMCVSVAGCTAPDIQRPTESRSPDITPAGAFHSVSSPASTRMTPSMRDMDGFIPAGMRILDTQQGDLNGQGGQDVLLVLDPADSGSEKVGEGQSRTLMLLLRDENGLLQKAAENSRVVGCKRCGGLAGDHYGYARIDKTGFTLAVSGGSRERWSDAYTFNFDPKRNTRMLHKVVSEVIDNATEEYSRHELGAGEFGEVSFTDFNPESLPNPKPRPLFKDTGI